MKRLAHVYTKHADTREHFELPEDYDRFHAWVSEHENSARDPYAFGKSYDIVKWYLSNMSFANRQGMYQVIVWQDEGESPVTVEHHRVKAIA
ncbi:hypothetical protein [Nocardia jiangxiensis]|uniref:hypothetical protein n=1 Tax=Nocardia jiangxiensis TaxID=282685 RepID=UPI0002E78432|nr:hypothetical protein [Nocardia jiangxiensis]